MPALYEEVKQHSIEVLARVYKIKDTHRLEEVMETWEKNKRWFLNQFDEPIVKIKSNITAEIDEETKRQTKDECARKIRRYMSKNSDDLPLEIRSAIEHYVIWELTVSEFFNNMIETEKAGVPKGMKAAKAIKKMFPEEPTEAQKAHILKIQMIMSEFQQKNKIHGDLYLSVHPVDFLTISTNNHNWTSCHGLYHAYSAGNIAYIQDQATCIAYLVTPGKEKVQINQKPELGLWNDKSWRMLIFMNEDCNIAAAGRHYPFEILSLEEQAMLKLVPTYQHNLRGQGLSKATLYNRLMDVEDKTPYWLDNEERQLHISGSLFAIKDFVTINDQRTSEEPRFYCDILQSNAYTPRFYKRYTYYVPSSSILPIRIGYLGCGCLTCGKDANCESFSLPFCKDCFEDGDKTNAREDWWVCEECGFQEHYSISEPLEDSHGHTYCGDCYREENDF